MRACVQAGRSPDAVTLLAVSKSWPAQALAAAAAAGQRNFGESYLQEALPKMDELAALDIGWHFIGPLQSNKTRPIAEHFAWAHSVDRLKIAQRLSEQRPAHAPALNICLQINVSGEDSKSGCAPEQAVDVAGAILELPRVTLRGVMAIPAPASDPATQRRAFATVRQTSERINQQLNAKLDTVSMGLSDDLEAAIIEGATLLRVGTAIFGKRS